MKEIVFDVESRRGGKEAACFVASWDETGDNGGITTQGRDLSDLQAMVREAVLCHFDEGKVPKRIRIHFVNDPVLATA